MPDYRAQTQSHQKSSTIQQMPHSLMISILHQTLVYRHSSIIQAAVMRDRTHHRSLYKAADKKIVRKSRIGIKWLKSTLNKTVNKKMIHNTQATLHPVLVIIVQLIINLFLIVIKNLQIGVLESERNDSRALNPKLQLRAFRKSHKKKKPENKQKLLEEGNKFHSLVVASNNMA